ncbi:hypothetical protein HAX54_024524 [Datura stramonium]|uniref:Uncharacterized protein n=1 Tax=Datura stramonium TaxID=4076 RepID=A0ABS8UZX3_DATST|nr:hypothetical protein [Datura stramonium]
MVSKKIFSLMSPQQTAQTPVTTGSTWANPDYKGVCHVALAQKVLLAQISYMYCRAFGQFATGIGSTDAVVLCWHWEAITKGASNFDICHGWIIGEISVAGKACSTVFFVFSFISLGDKWKESKVPTFLVPATQKVWMDIIVAPFPDLVAKHVPRFLRKQVVKHLQVLKQRLCGEALKTLTHA